MESSRFIHFSKTLRAIAVASTLSAGLAVEASAQSLPRCEDLAKMTVAVADIGLPTKGAMVISEIGRAHV